MTSSDNKKLLKIQYLPVKEVIPYTLNNKIHTAKQIKEIKTNIKEFWFYAPIVLDKDKVIIIGHGRHEAAKQLGYEEIPVLIYEDITPDQAKKLRLKDNILSDIADWNLENIKLELELLGDDELTDLFSGINLEPEEQNEEEKEEEAKDILTLKFGVPPFSILDTRQGYWKDRKQAWKQIIKNEGVTREGTLFDNKPEEEKSDLQKRITEPGTVSIFDPVLAEILVKWFAPKNSKVFDTFAWWASGFVYAYLGHEFTGIELRKEQADINNQRLIDFGLTNSKYIVDDGQNVLDHLEPESQDFYFSCPPYFDLEVYSDDPKDASNQKNYSDFIKILENSFTGAAKILKNNRFAAIVMSNVRDKNGLYLDIVGDIKRIMQKNGLNLYNDIVLINTAGSAPLRAAQPMKNRKVTRTHQNVMVFYKGDDALKIYHDKQIDVLDHLQAIQFHEDVLVFFNGNPKDIQKDFEPIDFSETDELAENEEE